MIGLVSSISLRRTFQAAKDEWMPRTPPDLFRGPGTTTRGGRRAETAPPRRQKRDAARQFHAGFAGIMRDKCDSTARRPPASPAPPRSSPLPHIMPRPSHGPRASCTAPECGARTPVSSRARPAWSGRRLFSSWPGLSRQEHVRHLRSSWPGLSRPSTRPSATVVLTRIEMPRTSRGMTTREGRQAESAPRDGTGMLQLINFMRHSPGSSGISAISTARPPPVFLT